MKQAGITIGCDPELFLKRDGAIVGSEKAIPVSGLSTYYGKIVRDGIQVEIHPNHSNLVTTMVGIKDCLSALSKLNGFQVCYDGVVKVSEAELGSLCKESQILGCQPSENIYGLKPTSVDPMKYLVRSAGGHVHIGLPAVLMEHRTRIVPVLDLLLGIPCVLLDRNPLQVERRKLYGRAGEYRLPPHGLEYRTLSNFWLHSPILAEFVFGMTQLAVDVVLGTVLGDVPYETNLLGKANMRQVVRAIQTNDYALALDIWNLYCSPFIYSNVSSTNADGFEYVIHPYNKGSVVGMGNLIDKDGLKVFGEDPVVNWTIPEYKGLWRKFMAGKGGMQ